MFQNHRLMPKEWEILVTILLRYNVQIHSIITKRCGDRRDWFCTRTSSFPVWIGKTKKRCFKFWKKHWWMLLIPLYLVSFYWLPRLETLFFLQGSYVVLNRVLRTYILFFFFSYSNSGWTSATHSISSFPRFYICRMTLNFLHKVLWDLCKKSTLQELVVMIAELQVELLSEAVSYN